MTFPVPTVGRMRGLHHGPGTIVSRWSVRTSALFGFWICRARSHQPPSSARVSDKRHH